MNRIFTSALLILAFWNTQAQTLTYATFSNCLSQTLNVKIANNSSFNTALTTTTGNGVTWNASGLTDQVGTPTIHFVYASPVFTPNGSLYPSANYVQYDPALTSVLEYNYSHISPDSMVDWGSYAPSGKHEVYQNSDKRLVFPFAYGQSFTDSYAKTNYSDATTVSSNQTGTRTVSFSGVGTLILPQGTFNNVALISELRTNSLGPNSTTFTWYDIANGKRLLFYEENNGSIVTAYSADGPTSITKTETEEAITIYPNPFSNTLRFDKIATPFETTYSLCEPTGKVVVSGTINNEITSIHTTELATGVYFLNIGKGASAATFKVVKQ
jgi:hypothetical protein